MEKREMKLKRDVLMIVSVIIISATILAACAPAATPTTAPATEPPAPTAAPTEAPTEAPTAAPEPVTIQYWHTHSDPEAAQLDEVIAAFEAANPGITVEPSRYAYSDFKTALLTAIASGQVPDAVRMDIVWVPEFADQGALSQLDGNMPGFEDIIADTFPGPLATNKWQDHYYGLPLDTNTQVLLWNKAVFEAAGVTAPPATMEEFAELACTVNRSPSEDLYGYAQGGTYFWAPAPVFYAMGGKVTDENITTATGYINSPESVAAFTMLRTSTIKAACPRTSWALASPPTPAMPRDLRHDHRWPLDGGHLQEQLS
jgi:multiple sugar transport system substrate-binding protein